MLLPTPQQAADTTSAAAAAPPVQTYVQARGVLVATGTSGGVTVSSNLLAALFAGPNDEACAVRRLFVQGPAGSSATVYVGGRPTANDAGAIRPGYAVDLTHRGDGDLASYDPPLYVPRGQLLAVVWSTSLFVGQTSIPAAGVMVTLA